MMTLYKLTNQHLQTHGGYQWTVGEWRETDGSGDLCGPGWLHAYEDPLLAALLNPIHANIDAPRLWECEADGDGKDERGLKCGVRRLRLVREMPLPAVTTTQRVAFGILCAGSMYPGTNWALWAERWLSGEDRAAAAAYAAAYAAHAAHAAYAAAAAAAYAAADAYADAWPGTILLCALAAMEVTP